MGTETPSTIRLDPRTEDADWAVKTVMAIEERIFEPNVTRARLRLSFEASGIAIVAEVGEADAFTVAGYAFGVPLEEVSEVEGPKTDPNLGKENTFYSGLAVEEAYRGIGIGARLKAAQLTGAGAGKHRWCPALPIRQRT